MVSIACRPTRTLTRVTCDQRQGTLGAPPGHCAERSLKSDAVWRMVGLGCVFQRSRALGAVGEGAHGQATRLFQELFMATTINQGSNPSPNGLDIGTKTARAPMHGQLRVVIATPFGASGRGGMDRLTDLIVENASNAACNSPRVVRLTVLGQHGKAWGSIVFAAAVVRLIALCSLGQVHLLHLNIAAYGSFYRKYALSRIARIFGVPYVAHIHSGRFGPFWNGAGPRLNAAIGNFMRNSARVIVLGSVYHDLFNSRLPDVIDKVEVLPNATRTQARRASSRGPEEPVRITFLGRLGPLKGTPQLIEALAKLSNLPGWTATLAGDGAVAASRIRINELGLAGRVEIPGWLQSDDVDRLLSNTDVLILPSFSEGLPLAIIEAFAAGIAVVATPVNAVVDVVQHERNGLLVEPGNVDAIAAALTRLIRQPELRRRLAETARSDHKERYDQGVFMRRLLALWAAVARAR